MSAFESARALVRDSIRTCFGKPMFVMTPQGKQIEIVGYVRNREKETNQVHLLETDAQLPERCTMLYRDKRYMLVFNAPAKGFGSDSQIMREYVMTLAEAGAKNEWSEF